MTYSIATFYSPAQANEWLAARPKVRALGMVTDSVLNEIGLLVEDTAPPPAAAGKRQVEISFADPLVVVITQPPREAVLGIRARFKVEVGQISSEGENMSETLQVGHYATVSVEWLDSAGNPAKVDGPTTWASTDASVLTCTVSTGNPLIANCHAEAIGSAGVQATADADLGEGIRTVTATLDVTVITGEAVGGSMSFKDMGGGPPPA